MKTYKKYICFYILIFQLWITFVNSVTIDEPIVEINQGKLKGSINVDAKSNTYYSFKGIPYAIPPLGSLRFKAPRPAESWTGTRYAFVEGNNCLQLDIVTQKPKGSEDCLYLNVYTPSLQNEEKLKPVMVWIHGGGFSGGSGDYQEYNPEYLITEDVVIVSINYRLWIVGFLSLEDTSLDVPGNAGLKDMVLALKWVKENIKKFKGDPDNVTIFGESAGSGAVHYLLLSPTSKGLFHRAILQSGVANNQWATGQKNAVQVANVLGNNAKTEKEALVFLQSISSEEIMKISELMIDPLSVNVTRLFSPVVENSNADAFITATPMNIMLSGNYNKVPIIIGFNDREGMLKELITSGKGEQLEYRPSNFEYQIPSTYNIEVGSNLSKIIAKKIEDFYYGSSNASEDDVDKFYVLLTDTMFYRGIHDAVKVMTKTSNAPIYMYRFSADTKLNLNKILFNITTPGVCHADDLFYMFRNDLISIEPGSIEDISINRVVKLWTNFAKTSNPTPDNDSSVIAIKWPTVNTTENHITCLDIDRELTIITDPEKERMQFWDNVEETINTNVKNI